MLACTACESDDPNDDGDGDGSEQTATSRTVLVYMAANNSPSLPYQLNYNDMVTAVNNGALDNGGHLLVFLKKSSGSEPQLIELTKEKQTILKSYPTSTNSVDPAIMKEVIADVKSLAPSKEYTLLLWSHASGWRSPARSWGQDAEYTGALREMSIPDLADALGNKQFKFIYMDCCFMGNIETLYELRNTTDYIVASSTETPYAGMDYARNIPEFFSKDIDLKKLASNTHETIAKLERTGDECGISISLYDMSNVESVRDAVKNIYAANKDNLSVTTSKIQQYGFSSWSNYFYDLRNYMENITADATLLGRLDIAMNQFIPLTLHTEYIWQQYSLLNAHGVSAFIPGSSEYQTKYNYDELQWYNDVVAAYF
jgi:hypothetical protein